MSAEEDRIQDDHDEAHNHGDGHRQPGQNPDPSAGPQGPLDEDLEALDALGGLDFGEDEDDFGSFDQAGADQPGDAEGSHQADDAGAEATDTEMDAEGLGDGEISLDALDDGVSADDWSSQEDSIDDEGVSQSEVEDLLFAELDPHDATEVFESNCQFRENDEAMAEDHGEATWAGSPMPADEMGIPVDQEAHLVDDDFALDSEQELEVIADDDGRDFSAADAAESEFAFASSEDGPSMVGAESAELDAEAWGDEDFELVLDEDVYEDAARDVVAADSEGDYQFGELSGSAFGEQIEDEMSDDASAQPSGLQLGGQEFFVLDERQPAAAAAGDLESDEAPELVGATEETYDFSFGASEVDGGHAAAGDREHGVSYVEEYPVEEGWEPIESGSSEPWADEDSYGEAAYEDGYEHEEGAYDDLEGEYAEGEELYYDDTPPAVVGGGARGGRVLRFASVLAAAAVIVGAGSVAVLRPQWLGMQIEPELVERVQVTRPRVEVQAPVPAMPEEPVPAAPAVETMPTQPQIEQPQDVESQVPTEPEGFQVTDVMQPTQPAEAPEPAAPVEIALPVVEPVPAEPVPAQEFLPVGEEMWVGQFSPGGRATMWSSVPPGARAFAQLHNGNFFVGHVKAVAADSLVLELEAGEVSLSKEELQTVTALGSEEYAELQQATTGVLRLSNSNRLVGEILRSVSDDNYVLQMHSDRVVVPKNIVEQFLQQPDESGLRFGRTRDEDEWLRKLAARHLKAMAVGDVEPDRLPVRFSDDNPVEKLPVEQVKRRRPQPQMPQER